MMSETTSSEVQAELNTLKTKVGELEARITHLEGNVEWSKQTTTETED